MKTSFVGASILNIITESLYDKPIVVFREYVQNSVDSLSSVFTDDNEKDLCNYIWTDNNNLYFLDNGTGINSKNFENKMKSIAFSNKVKHFNIGYKGIGRLSGMSYCKKLHFVNVISYKKKKFQEFVIDCDKYRQMQKSDKYNEISFLHLMDDIGILDENVVDEEIISILDSHENMFIERDSGFLVILEEVSAVLKSIMSEKRFVEDLSWMLPVPFDNELFDKKSETRSLFEWLSYENAFKDLSLVAAQSYKIYFNNKQLFRPLKKSMLRTYTCKSKFDNYAVCMTTFSNKAIAIDKNNLFSGIRMYIDNMLLCDENELIPMLQQYGFTSHGLYEIIQAVRGAAVMIYIVDKVNLSANARRTFIEVNDQDSLNFLQLVSILVNDIFDARYALSKYTSLLKKDEVNKDTIQEKKAYALDLLKKLARDEIRVEVPEDEEDNETTFNELSAIEKQRIIKNTITKKINDSIKSYLKQTNDFNLDTCFNDFKTWFLAN